MSESLKWSAHRIIITKELGVALFQVTFVRSCMYIGGGVSAYDFTKLFHFPPLHTSVFDYVFQVKCETCKVLLFRPHLCVWGEELYTQMGFFVLSNLADRYIHRREMCAVSLKSSSSVEFEIKKIDLNFVFFRGVIEV